MEDLVTATNVPSAPREPELKPDPEFELKMKLISLLYGQLKMAAS